MGNRLNMALGFGVQLDKDRLTMFADGDEDAWDKVESYFKDKFDRCAELRREIRDGKDKDWGKDDFEKTMFIMEYEHYIDIDTDEGTWKISGNKTMFDFLSKRLVFPAIPEDHAPASFLGYIIDRMHDSPIAYEIINMLGVGQGETSFEIHRPFGVKEAKVIKNKENGKDYYLPVTGSSIIERMMKNRVESGKIGADILASSKDECLKDATLAAKQTAYPESLWFTRGLEIVNIFFPEMTLEQVDRYLVGWWS